MQQWEPSMMYLCLLKSHNLYIQHLKFPGISTVDDDTAAVQGKNSHMHTEKWCYFAALSDNFNLLQHLCSSAAGSSIFQNRKVRQFILNSPSSRAWLTVLKALGSTRSPDHEAQLVIRLVFGMLISAAVYNGQRLSGSFSIGIDQKKCSVCLSTYKPSPPSSVGANTASGNTIRFQQLSFLHCSEPS